MTQARAFITLVFISVMFSAIAVVISVNQSNNNARKFCDVVSSVISKPIPEPTDPKANPSREQNYEWYIKFVTLDHRLGCSK